MIIDKKIIRIPRVRRIEYLIDYVNSVGTGLDEEEATHKLSERKREFALRKLRVLGRGRVFSKKIAVAKHLLFECRKLATYLGYVTRHRGLAEITEAGHTLLLRTEDERKQDICTRYFQAFRRARNFLRPFASSKTEYDLPMTKDNVRFKETATKQNMPYNQTSVEILRDIIQYFGFINWFPYLSREGRYHKIYSSLTKNNSSDAQITLRLNGVSIYPNSVNIAEFRKVIWCEYLGLTGFVPRRSVLYSDLRDKTCYGLHIPDSEFDKHIKTLLSGDSELVLVGSRGTIPFSPSLFTFLKSVPPKISGNIVVYLKMDRRKNE